MATWKEDLAKAWFRHNGGKGAEGTPAPAGYRLAVSKLLPAMANIPPSPSMIDAAMNTGLCNNRSEAVELFYAMIVAATKESGNGDA